MTAKPASNKPASTATTKNELRQIIKGLLLEMITDGTLPAAMKTYETLTEGAPVQRRQQPVPQNGAFLTEQQRAAMNANAVFGNDPAMAAVFADTLANSGADQLEEQVKMDAFMNAKQQQQGQAPVPGFGEAFPRNMLPPREAAGMLSESDNSHILPNAPSSNRWAELAFNKNATPKPNRPGFLPGQR